MGESVQRIGSDANFDNSNCLFPPSLADTKTPDGVRTPDLSELRTNAHRVVPLCDRLLWIVTIEAVPERKSIVRLSRFRIEQNCFLRLGVSRLDDVSGTHQPVVRRNQQSFRERGMSHRE